MGIDSLNRISISFLIVAHSIHISLFKHHVWVMRKKVNVFFSSVEFIVLMISYVASSS